MTTTDHLHSRDGRRMKRKHSLDTDPAGNLPHREGRACSGTPATDADALESLDAFLGALSDVIEYPNRITGSKVGGIVPKLRLLKLLDKIRHVTSPWFRASPLVGSL